MCALAFFLLSALLQAGNPSQPVNELTLARLRPGTDTLADAEKHYPAKRRVPPREKDGRSFWWAEPCKGHTLEVELDEQKVIRSITVSSLLMSSPPRFCRDSNPPPTLFPEGWKTGKGLALGDNCKRAISLYGEPDSRGPSTQSGRDLELLYYPFDWAGPKVPQVMEVTCDRADGRVVQITLAFPSL
jgi:hypothetical protein